MRYRSVAQLAGEADVLLEPPPLSRQARLERWAEALARQPGRLRAVPEVEHGGRRERDARRADGSPLTVAYEDPVLRAAGLGGDTIGDAAAFFGLSHAQLHHLVCSCQVVSSGEIRAAIAEHSLTTVEAVSERTGAATGCGGCRPDVEALLNA